MALMYKPNKGWVHVKNLGWLLRHAKEVQTIYVEPTTLIGSTSGASMHVELENNVHYYVTWASAKVCRNWLNRPLFKETKLWWINHWTTCGTHSTLTK